MFENFKKIKFVKLSKNREKITTKQITATTHTKHAQKSNTHTTPPDTHEPHTHHTLNY